MSHHYGLGNLSLEALTFHQNRATNISPSGKFKEKLLAKQKHLEEMLITNRVNKLQADHSRLQQQVAKANQRSQYAEGVI